jgi:hypothetical protein
MASIRVEIQIPVGDDLFLVGRSCARLARVLA